MRRASNCFFLILFKIEQKNSNEYLNHNKTNQKDNLKTTNKQILMEKVVGGIFLFELYFLIIERKLQNGFAHSPKNVIKIVYLLISIIKFLIMTIFMSHFFYFVYLTKMFSQIKLFSFSDLGIYNNSLIRNRISFLMLLEIEFLSLI